MSGKVKTIMKSGKNTVGKRDSKGNQVALVLAGAGVTVDHAQIFYNEETR